MSLIFMPSRPPRDQQPVDVQPGQVAQLGQALRSEFAVHELNLPEHFAINNYIPSFMGVSLRQSKCGMPYWPTELSSLRQRLKERASRHRPLSVRLHHRGQDSFHAPKTDDLCADLGQMIDSDVMRAAARPGLLVSQVEQATNFAEGEAKIACAANEAKMIGISRSIKAIASCASLGPRQEASALVVADRFYVHARSLRQGSNGKAFFHRHRRSLS